MTNIHYDFGATAVSLGDINHGINSIQEARTDIDNLFNVLLTVYDGEGAKALKAAHKNIDSELDDILHNMAITQSQAQEQQDAMQALDAQNAAQF